ncbi:MAG: TetR/AcrR family transcriptional regulator [Pseudomonadota bacterium]
MKISDEPQKRQSYHHGDLRAQLIEATRVLVEEKGPDRFSVSEACRAAGVSTAAPYKHFKDKKEMLRAVALAGMERQRQNMLDELAKFTPGTLDRVNALGRVYVTFAMREPGVFRLMFGLSEDHEEDEELVATGSKTRTLVETEVAQCRGANVVSDSDRQTAFLLWSFVHGLSFLQIDGKLAASGHQIELDVILDEVSRGLVAKPSGG